MLTAKLGLLTRVIVVIVDNATEGSHPVLVGCSQNSSVRLVLHTARC